MGTQSWLPFAISSSRSSMRAVKPTSTNSPKWSTSRSVTMRATSSGWSRFSFTTTYPRSMIVEMVAAYVLGRPMPCSSSALTRAASE